MKPLKRYRTDYLMPTSSFLQGAASVFNLAGNYYDFNFAKDGEDSDAKALENDFLVVMQDINDVFQKARINFDANQLKLDFESSDKELNEGHSSRLPEKFLIIF